MTRPRPQPALLIVGEALIDVVIHPDGRREEHPGGSPANVAITLGRLGHAPTLLTSIGDDEPGRLIAAWLRTSCVSLDPRSVGAAPTSRAVAHLDQAGAARYDLDIRWQLPDTSPGDADLVHIGSISATLSPGSRAVHRIVGQARERALISYDPNIRPALITDPAATRVAVEALAAGADIVKVSDEDLSWIDPSARPEDTARRWLGERPAMVIVTRGADGVTAFTSLGTVSATAPRVRVADTVGAGDTLTGAFLAGLVDRGVLDGADGAARRQRLHRLGRPDIEDVLRFSVAAAAVTVSRAGANPPWPSEMSVNGDLRLDETG
jgi:fructokinase